MRHIRWLCGLALLSGGVVVTGLAAPPRRPPELLPRPEEGSRFVPKFEAVAETGLLMEGLTQPNYRALEKHLQGKGPQDADTWKFARGQALLIAETGNLLLLRPPRNSGRDAWMRRAMDLRQSAADLADRLRSRDLERSRAALTDLATKCNSCHQTFRVPARIGPNAEPATPETKGGVRDTD
jgi:cytochrome c556